jgi:hypothetical protein
VSIAILFALKGVMLSAVGAAMQYDSVRDVGDLTLRGSPGWRNRQ